MSSSYDIIELDADSIQGTSTPLEKGSILFFSVFLKLPIKTGSFTILNVSFQKRSKLSPHFRSRCPNNECCLLLNIHLNTTGDVENEYDIISSGNEDDVVTVKGRRTTRNVDNAQNVKNARDRLQITDDDGISNALAFFGKSDSSDTLINDSDSDSDLDELVRANQEVVKTNTKKLNVKNEIISRTSAGRAHARRTDSDSSADRTLRNSNFSEDDVTITLTSPDDVTHEVFSPELTSSRDENKNVIHRLKDNKLTVNNNDVEVNRVEDQDSSAIIEDELQELKNLESPRQRTVARDITEQVVGEGSGSDGEVHEEIITKSQVNIVFDQNKVHALINAHPFSGICNIFVF